VILAASVFEISCGKTDRLTDGGKNRAIGMVTITKNTGGPAAK